MSYQFLCHTFTILFFLISIKASENPKKDVCLQQGTLCSEDCTSVLFCMGEGSTPIVSKNCFVTGESCFSNDTVVAVCSSNYSDCANPGGAEFECQQNGDFPDPLNCRKGYTCRNNQSKPKEKCICPPGSAWTSPAECSIDQNVVQSCCRDFEADCEHYAANNFGACPLSLYGYYYICDRSSGDLSVDVARCLTGFVFNPDTYSCEPIATKSAKNVSLKESVFGNIKVKDLTKREPYCEENAAESAITQM